MYTNTHSKAREKTKIRIIYRSKIRYKEGLNGSHISIAV